MMPTKSYVDDKVDDKLKRTTEFSKISNENLGPSWDLFTGKFIDLSSFSKPAVSDATSAKTSQKSPTPREDTKHTPKHLLTRMARESQVRSCKIYYA